MSEDKMIDDDDDNGVGVQLQHQQPPDVVPQSVAAQAQSERIHYDNGGARPSGDDNDDATLGHPRRVKLEDENHEEAGEEQNAASVADYDDKGDNAGDIPTSIVAEDDNTNVVIDDLENEPPTTFGSNDTSSPASAPALSQGLESPPPTPKKKFTVAETPRWRFVNQAKKTEGYSSVSAGCVVKGLTAEELIDKYKGDHPAEAVVAREIERTEKGNTYTTDVLGKLIAIEGKDILEETFEGTFVGRLRRHDDVEEERIVREEGEEEIDELASLDGETLDDPVPALHDTILVYEEFIGGMLASKVEEEEEEEAAVEVVKAAPTAAADFEQLDQVENQTMVIEEVEEELPYPHEDDTVVAVDFVKPPPTSADIEQLDQLDNQAIVEPKEEREIPKEPAAPVALLHSQSLEEFPKSSSDANDEVPTSQQNHKNRGLCALIIIVLCVIAALLGVMLGSKNANNENKENDIGFNLRGGEGADGEGTNKTTTTFAPNPPFTLHPTASSPPTSASTGLATTAQSTNVYLPVGEETSSSCPPNTKRFHLTVQLGQNPSGITWIIYDRCSTVSLYKCSRGCYNDSPPNYPVSSRGCLPSFDNESGKERGYVLHMSNMVGSPKVGYTMRYDGEIIVDAEIGMFTNLQRNYFGGTGDCSVPQKSVMPSAQPSVSRLPTSSPQPSEKPSGSIKPSTFFPSAQPSSQPSSLPSINPSISTDPSSQHSMNPSVSNWPTSQPSHQPSTQLSTNPSVSSIPSDQPSEHPSISDWPTSRPSESPSDSGRPSTMQSSAPSIQHSMNPSVSDWPTSQPSHQPSTQPSTNPSLSSMPSDQPSEHPSISDWPTSQPSESPSVSGRPSTVQSSMPTSSPMVTLRDIVHPPSNSVIPCRESIESEIAGRINGLSGAFCGYCLWKFSGFNCYQRVNFLATKYQTPQVEARQSLLDRAQCTVPATGIGEELQALIERVEYCGNVPIISEGAVRTNPLPNPNTATTREPISSRYKKPVIDESILSSSKPTAGVFV